MNKVYVLRKMGSGMGFKYIKSVFTPALLILLVSFMLNFAIIFIMSMAEGIERILIYLGSGDIAVSEPLVDDIEAEVFYVKSSSALAFSSSGSIPLYVKGVDFSSYFTKERKELLALALDDYSTVLNPIIISRKNAQELSAGIGERFTLLIYEEEARRTRPLLVTVAGLYDSGYSEFDSYLSYIPIERMEAPLCTEIVLSDHSRLSETLSSLFSMGYRAESYKIIYSRIYENVRSSIKVLYAVFALLALLASFFSGNISLSYIERDRKDIALLFLSGLSEKDIKKIYAALTMLSVLIALIAGLILAIIFSRFTPQLLFFLSKSGFRAMDAYLTSFEIKVPPLALLLINAFLLLFSYLSLTLALKVLKSVPLGETLKAE